jgi:hypothetical protein
VVWGGTANSKADVGSRIPFGVLPPILAEGPPSLSPTFQLSGQTRYVPSQRLPEDPVVDAAVDVADRSRFARISSQGTLGIAA